MPNIKDLASLTSTSSLSTLYASGALTKPPFAASSQLNSRVILLKGDITTLKLDAVVNAANPALLGGGGVDGAIHSAAGRELYLECRGLGGCDYGDAKISGGHRLPAKKIIHAVGPDCRQVSRQTAARLLASAYLKSLEILVANKLKTIAFPCISTGIYGYDNLEAAHVALRVVREFLEEHKDVTVVFCCFMPKDLVIYQKIIHEYFPPTPEDLQSASKDAADDKVEGTAGGKDCEIADASKGESDDDADKASQKSDDESDEEGLFTSQVDDDDDLRGVKRRKGEE